MNLRNPDDDDGRSKNDNSGKVPVRVIQKALEATTNHNVIITKIAKTWRS